MQPKTSETAPADESAAPPLETLVDSARSVTRTQAFWKLMLVTCAANLGVLLFLGAWVYFILFGLFMALLRVRRINAPLAKLLAEATGKAEQDYTFKPLTGPIWQRAAALLPSLFWLGVAGAGAWMLVHDGFLQQNLVYWMLAK